MPARILVVGSYAVALVMETPRLPAAGETLIGKGFRRVHGGKGSNQAVQAARLGAETRMCACLGRDSFGRAAVEMWEQEGIGTSGVSYSDRLPTGVGFVVVDEPGQNLITVDLGANNELSEAAAGKSLQERREQPDCVLSNFEIPVSSALSALKTANSLGKTTILNPAPASDLRDQDLSFIDYLTPNESEAKACLGIPPGSSASEEDLAESLIGLGVKNVLFTRGEQGARLISREADLTQDAYRVEVVDTTGAGDSFNAAFAVSLSEGSSKSEAMRFACAAGSLATTRHDTIPSYHTRPQVEALISSGRVK